MSEVYGDASWYAMQASLVHTGLYVRLVASRHVCLVAVEGLLAFSPGIPFEVWAVTDTRRNVTLVSNPCDSPYFRTSYTLSFR